MGENTMELSTLSAAGSLVLQARARLADELATLPPQGSPQLMARLRVTTRPQPVSLGALAHHLRIAVREDDQAAACDLFTVLLTRIEALNAHWAGGVVGRTPRLEGAAGSTVREDLLQELALALWRQMGREQGKAFELFFLRALKYLQQHVATAFMVQRGYWASDGARPSAHMVTLLLSELEPDDDGAPRESTILVDRRDSFSAADLADLRMMVLGLPHHERLTVVMRYWQQAPEAEIATSLGVSTRTVRTYLRSAYDTLRTAYAGEGGGA